MNDAKAAEIRKFLEKESSAFILLLIDGDLKFQVIDNYTNETLESALNWQLSVLNKRKQQVAAIVQ